MTDDTIHTCSYSCERPGCIRAQRDYLAARLAAETSNARGKVEYEYEVWQGDVLQAGGSTTDYASAQSEANHYAAMYAQDGPVEVRIYEKRLLSADKVQPKRRRYDPYGSLSEYGIFPECDAQPPAEEGERDWLAPAMDEMAEWRMDALEAGSEDGLQAEIEALRAEVREAREFRDKMANAIGNDQLRRFIEKHGEPVPLTIRMQEAEARAERLAKEVEALRAKTAVTMGVGTGDGKLFVHGDHESIKAAQAIVLERDALRAEVERLRADRDSWEQQASDRVADWHAEHLRAERLAEALRELVDVFSESGMYDEEVFDKARAALGQEEGE